MSKYFRKNIYATYSFTVLLSVFQLNLSTTTNAIPLDNKLPELILYYTRTYAVGSVCSTIIAPFMQGYVNNVLFQPPIAKYGPNILLQQKKSDQALFDGLVYPPKTKNQLESYIARLDLAVKRNRELPNLLLTGPPGTGKTEIAKRLGMREGFTYALMSGSSFKPFKEKKSAKLTKLFKWAESRSIIDKRKVVLFFDEAEILFESRKTSTDRDHASFLAHFLSLTGSASKNYLIVVATNRPHKMDPAMLGRRLPNKIEVEKPGQNEIISLLEVFFSKNKKTYPQMNTNLIDTSNSTASIASLFTSFAPADIQPMVNQAFDEAFIHGESINPGNFQAVVEEQKLHYRDYLTPSRH